MHVGFTQALAQLVQRGLSQKSQGHLTVADAEIEGAGTLPAQFLVVMEKLLHVPALGKVAEQAFQCRARPHAAAARLSVERR